MVAPEEQNESSTASVTGERMNNSDKRSSDADLPAAKSILNASAASFVPHGASSAAQPRRGIRKGYYRDAKYLHQQISPQLKKHFMNIEHIFRVLRDARKNCIIVYGQHFLFNFSCLKKTP